MCSAFIFSTDLEQMLRSQEARLHREFGVFRADFLSRKFILSAWVKKDKCSKELHCEIIYCFCVLKICSHLY